MVNTVTMIWWPALASTVYRENIGPAGEMSAMNAIFRIPNVLKRLYAFKIGHHNRPNMLVSPAGPRFSRYTVNARAIKKCRFKPAFLPYPVRSLVEKPLSRGTAV